jgi:Fe-S cluster assembly iron-binding protein IscA
MISLSAAALEQIKLSSTQEEMDALPVRIAIKEQDDGSFHYAMGFDEQRLPGDSFLNFDGVNLVVSEGSKELAEGMTNRSLFFLIPTTRRTFHPVSNILSRRVRSSA